MKKYLPLILLFFGILILVMAFIFVRGRKEKEEVVPSDEEVLLNLPLEERPFVTLIPTSDGHFLNMKIEKIDFGAFSLDYELIYQVPGGVQQGVPGSVNLAGKKEFEAELLLGSESSGNFRYDEGVEEGTLTLRFRDEDGQLLTRFTTEFHLQTSTRSLSSLDKKFKYDLASASRGYFVTMNTVGTPKDTSEVVVSAIYGVFSSDKQLLPGSVTIENFEKILRWPDERFEEEVVSSDGNMPDVGVFAGIEDIPVE
jgi:hypothetical protein